MSYIVERQLILSLNLKAFLFLLSIFLKLDRITANKNKFFLIRLQITLKGLNFRSEVTMKIASSKEIFCFR